MEMDIHFDCETQSPKGKQTSGKLNFPLYTSPLHPFFHSIFLVEEGEEKMTSDT
jgi:hypothetical protein